MKKKTARKAPRKLVCLETYWSDRQVQAFRERSVRPFFEGRAVVEYVTDVNWMDSMLADLLFLRRFYADPDPWTNLRRIHQSVLDDFAPARVPGHVLHLRRG